MTDHQHTEHDAPHPYVAPNRELEITGPFSWHAYRDTVDACAWPHHRDADRV